MAVTLNDIAKVVGVKKQTVSVVLNNKPTLIKVGAETRQRILETARQLQYHPNGAARSLATGRTHRVALWVPVIDGQYFHEVTCILHRLLLGKHYEIVTRDFHSSLASLSSEGFSRIDVDGVLLYGSGSSPATQSLLRDALSKKIPVVQMGMMCQWAGDFVLVDLYAASCQAVEYLIKSGCSRIAYMCCVEDDRSRAYREVMGQAGRKGEWILSPDFSRSTGRRVIKEYVEAHGCPDGIFCISDEMAIGVCRGLREMGIRVPEDVVLVGCEGIEDLDYLESPISSVSVPKEEMCRLAWEYLYNRMVDPGHAQQTASLSAYLKIRK